MKGLSFIKVRFLTFKSFFWKWPFVIIVSFVILHYKEASKLRQVVLLIEEKQDKDYQLKHFKKMWEFFFEKALWMSSIDTI